ncbi:MULTISPECIES: hypothetical protein [unclassified Brevundimonas]|uniref:hypothetical protein n=1 Tax=unclassified Brevundimonas TaxID=2622653 RepID=UPI0025B90B0D|nr:MULTISPECIES: hypothetical protein [unclassified Brevundimonas]
MVKKIMGVTSAAFTLAASMSIAAPIPAAAAMQEDPEGYYCFGGGYDSCKPIAYSYEVYADETMTTLIGSGSDTCNGGPFVTSPSLPTGYTVKTRMFVCSDMGPYLPWDW